MNKSGQATFFLVETEEVVQVLHDFVLVHFRKDPENEGEQEETDWLNYA